MAAKKATVASRGVPVKLILPRSLTSLLPSSERVLEERCRGLEADVAALAAEMADMKKKGDAIQLARAFVVLHRIKAAIEAVNGKEGGTFPALFNPYKKEHVPELFEAAGVTSLPLDEGYRVGVSHKTVASIKKGQKEDAYKWLRANNMGDLIVETVNSSTLSATFKTMIEEHNVEPPEETFTVERLPNTSVTKGK